MYASTVRGLLVRGMLAGLIAGLFAFAVAYVVGEPPVRGSIAVEEAAAAKDAASAPSAHAGHGGDAASGEAAEEEELVSRPVQSTVGLATGVLVYGVALGGIASLAFSFALGRVGGFSPRATAALTGAGAFALVYLVPFLKYPATPPAVGNPDTIGQRTTLFFLMILLSVLLGVGAIILGRRLAPRLGNWNATLTAGAGFIVAAALAFAFLPDNSDAVQPGFPAALLWEFRVASLAVQLVLWTVFAIVFGVLAQRLLATRAEGAEVKAPAQQEAPALG
ncbi:MULTISPECIES: CbtA family protein [Streptomyces]|uniref:Membrane protein n=1 Tax=Streptomyces spororaveus TaxID=284039 RepID=A0ABQ3TN80_9ACTN|nr:MULTISPECIES: CbtA family protein [Streptomyces]MCM9077788.1 CbtA family protein [Streptomyces spororaveus]MCX5307733.1 CbtA family protein [Streptomyces sp. NBC_00160]GHI81865.1 membrane protein [Streptomyces spororaveus]